MSHRHECMHPCSSCARHVRSYETACPFCDAPLPGACVLPDAPPLARVASRAALAFFATAAIVACGKTSSGNDPQPQLTKYGPPPMDIAPPPEPAVVDAGKKEAG
jgi:hypothetical protein